MSINTVVIKTNGTRHSFITLSCEFGNDFVAREELGIYLQVIFSRRHPS